MARSKTQQNAIALDPNREKLSINMSVTPGDPTTQMNNPGNVTSFGPQLSALPGPDGKVVNEFPYGDKGLMNATQLGVDGGEINPAFVPRSQMPNQGSGTMRGHQRGTLALFAAPTPPAELMAASRMNMHPSMQDKPQSFMGLTGQPANIQTPPGFNAGQGTPLPTMDQYAGMAMTPGATKQTKGKKGGKA
tara:strand:+ start:2012 stop:2584 length:573 start_codon:yes stop_codon:yes gene_type:complete